MYSPWVVTNAAAQATGKDGNFEIMPMSENHAGRDDGSNFR